MQFKNSKPLIYFAAPLFSEAELAFNTQVTAALEEYVDVYLPQRDGGKLVDLIARGVSRSDAYRSIFERDLEALKECDALVLILDGRSIDEGACFELGVAHSSKKTCVGLQTDPRRLLSVGNNPMIECALSVVFSTKSDLATWAQEFSRSTKTSMQHISAS